MSGGPWQQILRLQLEQPEGVKGVCLAVLHDSGRMEFKVSTLPVAEYLTLASLQLFSAQQMIVGTAQPTGPAHSMEALLRGGGFRR